MKKRILFLALALLMAFSLVSGLTASAQAAEQLTDELVYSRMIALKPEYPEGMRWTDDDYYEWKGGIYFGGFGCVGFAFLLSDAAFNDLPARCYYDSSEIRVGDVVRINDDTHSVIVLQIDGKYITLSEGNYNFSIHWGRKLTYADIERVFNYGLTRYPEDSHTSATPTASNVTVNGTKTAFTAYNINGNNYFKLRDIAKVVSGSGKQFDVAWDGEKNTISLASGKPYTVVGGELAPPASTGEQTAIPTTSAIYMDGNPITLAAYHINGNNYFKLRDIGRAFNFGVTWVEAKDTIEINTNIEYTPD